MIQQIERLIGRLSKYFNVKVQESEMIVLYVVSLKTDSVQRKHAHNHNCALCMHYVFFAIQ